MLKYYQCKRINSRHCLRHKVLAPTINRCRFKRVFTPDKLYAVLKNAICMMFRLSRWLLVRFRFTPDRTPFFLKKKTGFCISERGLTEGVSKRCQSHLHMQSFTLGMRRRRDWVLLGTGLGWSSGWRNFRTGRNEGGGPSAVKIWWRKISIVYVKK